MKPIPFIAVAIIVLAAGCGAKKPGSPEDPTRKKQALEQGELDPAKPGPGMVKVEVYTLLENPQGGVLILLKASDDSGLVVPMVVGETEAGAIARRLSRQKFIRPLTHDLLETVLDTFKVRIAKVEIDDLQDATFLARLFLVGSNNKVTRLDARPSDSIALAIGAGAPIFIHKGVLSEIGEPIDDWTPTEGDTSEPSEAGGEAMLLL